MENYIDPVAQRVDENYDHDAHMKRYPLKLGGMPLKEWLSITAAKRASEIEFPEAA